MKKILLVDDDQNLSKVYEFFLKKQGYDVVTCKDAQEALQFILNGRPVDLFILDVELPDMSGLELMEQIKSNGQYAQTPIIINSGYEHYRENFTSWLANEYLVKQSDLSGLGEKVRGLLA